MNKYPTDYNDYVFKDGKMILDFYNIYQYSEEAPGFKIAIQRKKFQLPRNCVNTLNGTPVNKRNFIIREKRENG